MTAVLIAALLLVQQAPRPATPETCTLSGTVSDTTTGAPLGKVDLIAEKVGGKYSGLSTTTDAKGNFLIADVEPGHYRISAGRNGYLDTYYGAKRASGTGTVLNLSPGQKIEDLKISLIPFGVIAGIIRDTDGEPIIGENVNLYRSVQSAGRVREIQVGNRQTDDLGQYRFLNLRPGRYYVSAVFAGRQDVVDTSMKSKDRPEIRVTTFYPGTTDPTAAQPVEVSAGSRVSGIDFAIVRSRLYRISAHIDLPPGLRTGGRLAYSIDGLYPAGAPYSANSNGDLVIPNVAPGSYKVQLYVNEPDAVGLVFDPARVPVYCALSIPVVVDRADVEGLRVTAGGCGMAIGHLVVEGNNPPSLTGAIVDLEHGDHKALVRADGTFATSLSTGPGDISLSGVTKEKGLYVKSIRAGTLDVLRNGFTANPGERVELEIVLGSDGGQIQGIVSDPNDKPVLGATVVLIPNDPSLRSREDYTWDAVTDQAGHFELKNIAPGDYKLFAWDDIEPGDWFDPQVISGVEAKGQPVIVKAKDPANQTASAQTVNLHVIQ